MLLRNYGIQLRSLSRDDLELIRQWRNSDFIRKNMLFRDIISKSKQAEWFNSLDHTSLYLIIEHRKEKIGLIHIKDINRGQKSGEAGIFIGSEPYRKSHWPIVAILTLMDCCFKNFGFIKLKAKTRKENKSVLEMNYALGYQIVHEAEEYLALEVKAATYFEKSAFLKDKIKALATANLEIQLSPEEKAAYLF